MLAIFLSYFSIYEFYQSSFAHFLKRLKKIFCHLTVRDCNDKNELILFNI